MPLIRFSASMCHVLLATSISLNSEIISPCSHYMKKGLAYITITDLFSCQPSSYLKYTKANIYSLCNMRSVSLNKYIFLTYFISL
jgi:hypothetical protein